MGNDTLKKITIDGINLGSNFEIASYRTQRNSSGIAPLRGNGNLNASNNFVIDDEVVLIFKVNKSDLVNFIKIFARFKSKGMLLVHSKLLAYKLIHGEVENGFSFNKNIMAGGVAKDAYDEIRKSVMQTEHFFAMLSDFNIKSLSQTSNGFEIEFVLQVFSELINSEVVDIYNKKLKEQNNNKTFSTIDMLINSEIEKEQSCSFIFTATDQKIIQSDFGQEHAENITNLAKDRLSKITKDAKKQKGVVLNLLKTKLTKIITLEDYQIAELEIRMSNNIVNVPIQGKPKPFKQHLGVGECYITLKIVLDENDKDDKSIIKELKRFTSLKQSDIYTEIQMPLINAFDLKSITIANLFFTNDSESDAVVVNIVFAANGYSREDMSIYNEAYGTLEMQRESASTYLAFSAWLNNIFYYNQQGSQRKLCPDYKNYIIDKGISADKNITLELLSKSYNDMEWQNEAKDGYENILLSANKIGNGGTIVSDGKYQDLVGVGRLNNLIESYVYILHRSTKNNLENNKVQFRNKFNKDINKDNFNNFHTMLSFMASNMVSQSSNAYGTANSLQTFVHCISSFYYDFYDRIDMLYQDNAKYINNISTNFEMTDSFGEIVDTTINNMLSNLGKTPKTATVKSEVENNDIYGLFLIHLKHEKLINNILDLKADINVNNKNQEIRAANKREIEEAVANMINNLNNFFNNKNNVETVKSVVKTIIKLKMFGYVIADDENKEKLGSKFLAHIFSTVLLIPLMIDIFKNSSYYGFAAMHSSKLVIQYYKTLNRIQQYPATTDYGKLKVKGLGIALQNIFGKDYHSLLKSTVTDKKTFKEKKDYQKYLGVSLSNEISNFKFFFDVIMNTQVHEAQQQYFSNFLQNINSTKKEIEAQLGSLGVLGKSLLSSDSVEKNCDSDNVKRKIIKEHVDSANIIYKDMFASDIETSGKLYSFNKLLGGNKIQSWFSQNEIATKQASLLKFIYKKYENIQKMFAYEYNKMMPDYQITLIQENIANGILHKREYINLNDYVGLDKVISISINFDEETRIKTAILQIIDTTNVLQNMENEIVTRSQYRDMMDDTDKQQTIINQDYFNKYPNIKAGQLIKIEMGYLYTYEGLETEFTGTIINVQYGKVTTIVCNNFAADLMAGNSNIERHDGGGDVATVGEAISQFINKHQFWSIKRQIADSIGDEKDQLAKSKINYNKEFIPDNSAAPYQEYELASNYNILAESIRKQISTLVHLNNENQNITPFGTLSNELNETKSTAHKVYDVFDSSQRSVGKIYDNINNVDQDMEMYGALLILVPNRSSMLDKYTIKKLPEITKLFQTKVDNIATLCRTGSPFCPNNFKKYIYDTETKIDGDDGGLLIGSQRVTTQRDEMTGDEESQARGYVSFYSSKSTNTYNILKIIEKRLPGVFFNVVENGDYATLFLGREKYNIKRDKCIEKITASDFNWVFELDKYEPTYDVSKSSAYNNINKLFIDHLEKMAAIKEEYLAAKFSDETQKMLLNFHKESVVRNTEILDQIETYTQSHHVISGKNLISNNIIVNENFANSIFVDYALGVLDVFREIVNLRWGGVTLKLYSGLSKEKSRLKKIDHVELSIQSRDQALSVAQSALLKEVESIYSGTITTTYMPGIKYRDEITLQDYENKIFGTVVVKDFKHIFDTNGAFTIITPMLKASINSLSNELLADSFWSQFLFTNPNFKTSYDGNISEIDKIIKNTMAQDTYNKPIYFEGYGFETKDVNENDTVEKRNEEVATGFVDQQIMMNTHLPLKIFPLIQKDKFMFPDMEDYGKQKPTKIAALINYWYIKGSQFGYFFNEYSVRKQIGLFASKVFHDSTRFLRNWFDNDIESLKYQSPDLFSSQNVIVQQIIQNSSYGQSTGTADMVIDSRSRVIPLATQENDCIGVMWFNAKDMVCYSSMNDPIKTMKGTAINPKLTFEKITIIGDLASQFDVVNICEIYAETLEEAGRLAKKICDRANFLNKGKTFEVTSMCCLNKKGYEEIFQNKKWIPVSSSYSASKVYNENTGFYTSVLKKVVELNKEDILSLSALGGSYKNNQAQTKVNSVFLNEYCITIHNSKSITKCVFTDDIKQTLLKDGKVTLYDFKEQGINKTCYSMPCYGYSVTDIVNAQKEGVKRSIRNMAINLFEVKDENKKCNKKKFATASLHNFFGTETDVGDMNKRKTCAQNFFDKVKIFSKVTGYEIIINGDFNLDLRTLNGNGAEFGAVGIAYAIQNNDLKYVPKILGATTAGSQPYDKFFVTESVKDKSVGNIYSDYLSVAKNTYTNEQSDVSDHKPIFLRLGDF